MWKGGKVCRSMIPEAEEPETDAAAMEIVKWFHLSNNSVQ